MKRQYILVLIFLFAACAKGFCQSPEGKPDGIQKEYYKDGTLKYEYLVKDGRLNGFLERYDESGDLEYREHYIDDVFDGVDREYYHYILFFWYQHMDMKVEEVFLSEEEALEKFGYGYEAAAEPLEGNWMGIVRTLLPTGEDPNKKNPVTLAGISKNYVYLKEYEDKEGIEPFKHYFYDVIQVYRVSRSADIDYLFNVPSILEVFQRRNTGIEYGTPFGVRNKREGSRLLSVQQYIGEPDYIYPLQPSGWFDVYYEKEDLRILGHGAAVYYIESGRPEWADSPKYRNKDKDRRFKRKIEQFIEHDQ